MRKLLATLIASIMCLTLVGCSSTSNDNESNSEYGEVTVDTYKLNDDGTKWSETTQTFTSMPSKVVCNNQGIAELMIRLGLKDNIVGVAAVFAEAPEDIKEDFDSLNVIAQSYASKEAILGANPDLVIGRGDLITDNADYGSGTVEQLNAAGINAYVTQVSNPNSTFESYIKDIENLGKIFKVEDKASELINEYQTKIEGFKNNETYKNGNIKLACISTVDNGIPTVGTGSSETIQNEAYKMVGITNIFENETSSTVSLETLIEKNPDVLVLFDYAGGPDMDTMIQSLYENDALQNINAIKNKKVVALEFNDIYGGSGALYSAVEDLAKTVYN